MKTALILALGVLIGLAVREPLRASLTLPTTLQETNTAGGTVTDNRNVAALTVTEADYSATVTGLKFCKGKNSTTPSTFVPSPFSTCVTVSINTTSGVWSTSAGQTGTFTAPQLTSLKTNEINFRNFMETFFGPVIYPGSTQVAN